jgi:SAM-dependent methyltransferase
MHEPVWSSPVFANGVLYVAAGWHLYALKLGGQAPAPETAPATPQPQPASNSNATQKAREPDAIFVPTPRDVVERMLELAKVNRDDVVADLGCGDGRIVVMAAKQYGCKAAGYDIDPVCVKLARASVEREGVPRLITIEQKDIFTLDLSRIDVVTLDLLPRMNARLIPQLARLRPGARIVAHAFEIPGIPPDRVVTVTSKEDSAEHKAYLWTAPLKLPGEGK